MSVEEILDPELQAVKIIISPAEKDLIKKAILELEALVNKYFANSPWLPKINWLLEILALYITKL